MPVPLSTPMVLCCSAQQCLHLQELDRDWRAAQRNHLQSRKEARHLSARISGNKEALERNWRQIIRK